ncbi:MAG: hypothetical protein ACREA0_04525 [bacterium]
MNPSHGGPLSLCPPQRRSLGLLHRIIAIASPKQDADRVMLDIASANLHASGALAAAMSTRRVLIDIGSTTTDIIRFGDGRIQYRG